IESLGIDIPRSALAVKYAKAFCPDADLECEMKEVDQAGKKGWAFRSVKSDRFFLRSNVR
nr:hypothetical protein [Tanacetum cinerariifolium]